MANLFLFCIQSVVPYIIESLALVQEYWRANSLFFKCLQMTLVILCAWLRAKFLFLNSNWWLGIGLFSYIICLRSLKSNFSNILDVWVTKISASSHKYLVNTCWIRNINVFFHKMLLLIVKSLIYLIQYLMLKYLQNDIHN